MDVQRLALQAFAKVPPSVLRRMAGPPVAIRGRALDPMFQLIAKQAVNQPGVETMTPAEAREALEAAAATLQSRVSPAIAVSEETMPGPGGELPYRLYRPRDAQAPASMILFFHFGGCVIGSRAICDGFCGMLAERTGAIVLNVEYRLAPEHPFPAAIEDALAAYRWSLENADALGADASRVVVAGDSAGGLLSAVIAQEARREGWTMPRFQVLIYPWLVPYSGLPSYSDFGGAYPLSADIMAWFGGHVFARPEDKTHRWAAPLEAEELTGLPEALIYTAGYDPLRDEGEQYVNRLRDAGVPVHHNCFEDLPHSFTMFGIVPSARTAMVEIADDLGGRI